jgi:dTDP-glucose 4,6-dehydratase
MDPTFSRLPEEDLALLSEQAREDAAPWAKARVLLTGGTGFVGKGLLEAFLHLCPGITLVVPTRDPKRFQSAYPHLAQAPAVQLVAWDLTRPAPESLLRQPFDALVHGAIAHGPNLISDHRASTRHVLELPRHPSARLLYLSSGAAQGPLPSKLAQLPETYMGPLDPDRAAHDYGRAKREAEALWFSTDPRAVVARLFAFYGPHLPLHANYAAGNFMRDALVGGPIRIQGDGTPMRGYLYTADLTRALLRLLAHGTSGQTYQVGGSEGLSIRELAEAIARSQGAHIAVEVAHQADPGALPPRYVPEASRLRDELGFVPKVDLAAGLSRWARWQASQPSLEPRA